MCDSCKKRPATHHIKQTINGDIREYNLCAECAEKAGLFGFAQYGGAGSKLNALFSGIKSEQSKTRCPVCGETAEGIARSGFVGCGMCYEVFKPMLTPHIAKLHGSAKHVSSAAHGAGAKENSALAALLSEQAEAIRTENFERAAELRDRISELRGGGAK